MCAQTSMLQSAPGKLQGQGEAPPEIIGYNRGGSRRRLVSRARAADSLGGCATAIGAEVESKKKGKSGQPQRPVLYEGKQDNSGAVWNPRAFLAIFEAVKKPVAAGAHTRLLAATRDVHKPHAHTAPFRGAANRRSHTHARAHHLPAPA